MGWIRRASLALLVLGAELHVTTAHAQAIVDEPGSLSASLSHEYGFADTIVESQGLTYPSVYVNSQTTTLGVEYVPLARLGISASLPLVGTVYDRDASGMLYDPHGPYDDGSYHFTLQDLHGDVRYQLLESPLALAVNVGITLPVADYPVQGSAAPGRHLTQARFGFAVSYSPEPLPRAFANLEYNFTLSEKVDVSPDTEMFSQNRSDALLQLGYLATDKLAVYLLSSMRYQHDGVDFVNYDTLTMDQQTYHDLILREAALTLGAGAMYQFTDKFYATVHYVHFLTGRNTLTMDVAGVSVGWNIL